MTTSPADGPDPNPEAVNAEGATQGAVASKDMAGKLVRRGGIYALARVATLGAPFLLLPVYAKLLGDEGLGTVELLASVAAFLTPLLLQGQNGSWARLRFDHESDAERAVFDSTITWYLLASGAVGLLVLALIGPWLARWAIPGIPFYPLGLLTVVAAAAGLFSTICERKLQTEERPLGFAVFTIVRACLTLGTIALFVVGFRRGVLGKLEAEALSCCLLAVVSWVVIKPGSPRNVSGSVLRQSLAYGWPLLPHSLAALSGGLVARLLLNGMLGTDAVGVFSMGFRLATGANVIATALNQAYAPFYVQTVIAADKQPDRRVAKLRVLARSALVAVVLASCVALTLTAFGRELIALIATPEFDESWRVLALLNGAAVAYALYLPFSQAILQNLSGRRFLPLLTLAAAAANILATVVLVPPFGIVGAACALLAGNCLLTASVFVVGQRQVSLPLDRQRWILVVVVVAVTLSALALVDWISTPGLLTRLLPKAVLLSIGLAALLTLGGGLRKVRRLLRPTIR
jgi:O-antigen/teichoic acid export membrane protein